MAEKNMFDYFYGSQSEQFSFFRLPKVIVRDERFKKISSDAKILYGIMLDRMSLSRENHWVDNENRVYIIFTLNEVMKEFECCKRKAGSLMAELDTKSGIGLIEKKRQGLGKPDLIYLKNFIVQKEYTQHSAEEESKEEPAGIVVQLQSGKDMQHKISEFMPIKESKNAQLQYGVNMPLQSSMKIQPQSGENLHIQSGINVQQQSGETVPFQNGKDMHVQTGTELSIQSSTEMQIQSGNEEQPNNTEYNKTDSNENESINHINLSKREERSDMIDLYRRIVKQNICYDDLYENTSIIKKKMLDEIVELMVEVLVVNRQTIRIAGADYPYPLVKSRFMCIGYDHVEYVLDCLEQTSTKIGNIKAYILTSLFNATSTIDTYYTAMVHHHMVEGI